MAEPLASQRADLETLRAGLLASFATADDAVKAQIAGQLRAVIKDLAALGAGETVEVSAADEIAARRKARLSDADDSAPTARRGEPRRRGGGHRTG